MPTPPALIELPTGDLSLPFKGCADLLASCPSFQAMVGADSSAAALAFIDYPLRDITTYGYPIPGAIISDDDHLHQHRKRLGERGGSLLLELFDEMSSTYYGTGETIDYRNDDIAMRNRFGTILQEMLNGGGNVWRLTQWKKADTATHLGPPDVQRDDPNAQQWFRFASFVLDWV